MAETTYKKGELLFEGDMTTTQDSYVPNIYSSHSSNTTPFNQNILIVHFNNIEYICEKTEMGIGDLGYYGGDFIQDGLDFSIYPFSFSNTTAGPNDSTVMGFTIYTDNPGTYSLKIYTAISDSDSGSDSDSSSEPITIRSYIDKNLTNLNWNILPQIFESEGVELTEEIKMYLKETPKNTNWNVFKQMTSSEEISLTVVFDEDVSFSREAYAPQAECTIQHGILSETPDVLYVQMGEENFMLPKCGDNLYGEMNNDTIVFTTYPLYIYSNDNYTYMATPTVKTVHIKISIAN